MSKKHDEVADIDQIAGRAQSGEDVSGHFTGKFTANQRVNMDMLLGRFRDIDAECRLVGVARQA